MNLPIVVVEESQELQCCLCNHDDDDVLCSQYHSHDSSTSINGDNNGGSSSSSIAMEKPSTSCQNFLEYKTKNTQEKSRRYKQQEMKCTRILLLATTTLLCLLSLLQVNGFTTFFHPTKATNFLSSSSSSSLSFLTSSISYARKEPQEQQQQSSCKKRSNTRLFVKSSTDINSFSISDFNNDKDDFIIQNFHKQQQQQQNNNNNPPEWKFFDTARIHVQGGNGGNGCVSFRREKGEARGGPNGGNGGNGGTIYIKCDTSLNTLAPLRQNVHTRATSGRNGLGKKKDGIKGNDEYIHVPPGTIVRDLITQKLAGELQHDGEQLCVARGGRGGRGNAAFKTNRVKAPKLCERGEPGIGRWLSIELKLVADVGFLGKPNSGKSTLLKASSNAKPKIANYPFTTITPNLGVCDLLSDNSNKSSGLVLCDIPGLIEGAADGTGMGIAFLRHVQRCRVLLHVIDGNSDDPLEDYKTIQKELEAYDDILAKKPQVIVINKIDIPDVRDMCQELISKLKKESGHSRILTISAATNENVKELMFRLQKFVDAQEKRASEEETGAYISPPAEIDLSIAPLEQDSDDYEIVSDPAYPGQYRISGSYIEQVAKMTHWEYPEAIERFGRQLIALGISDTLKKYGAKDGDLIMIDKYDFEFNTGMTNIYIPDELLEQEALYEEQQKQKEEENDNLLAINSVSSQKKNKNNKNKNKKGYNYENAPYRVMDDDVEEFIGFFNDEDGEWDRMLDMEEDDDEEEDDYDNEFFKTQPGDDVWTS